MLRTFWFTLATALLATTLRAEPPTFPCKTPQKLLSAVRYALENQDTNLFWSLHCWTNVPPISERNHKGVTSVYFKQDASDHLTFSSFRIIDPPHDYTNTARFRNGGERYFNIPVTGIIAFREKARKANPVFPSKPLVYSADGEAPFGRTADGTYALAVKADTPGTNPPPKFKLPPGGITNLLRR